MTAVAADPPLPTLRTVHQVQVLSNAEAARSWPVHLARAQVSFWEPSSHTAFLLDDTDAIRAKVTGPIADEMLAGDLVSVDGSSGPGDAGPLILDAHIRKLGHAALPVAPLVSLDRLLSGAYDAHWVAVAGIVQSVIRSSGPNTHSGEVGVTLGIGQDSVDVSAPASGDENLASLVDAEVRLRAVAENEFNQRGLLTATRLHMPGLAFLQLVRPSIPDPFALPLIGIRDISLTGGESPGHRLRTRGVITSTWGDQNFSINDAGHGMFVSAEQPAPVHIGDVVDVVGYPWSTRSTSITRRCAGLAPGRCRRPCG